MAQCALAPEALEKVPVNVVVCKGEVVCEPLGPTLPIGMIVPPEAFVEVQESVAD